MKDKIKKVGKKLFNIRREVLEDRIVSHTTTLLAITGIIACMELFLLIRSLTNPSNASDPAHWIYVTFYSILLVASLSAFIFIVFTKKKAASWRLSYYIMASIYCLVIACFSAGISYLDMAYHEGSSIVFITTVMAVPCICLVDPRFYSVVAVALTAALLSMVSYVGPNPIVVNQGALINYIIYDIIVIFISFQSNSLMNSLYDKSSNLEVLSYTDPLTGLRNRRSFNDEIKESDKATPSIAIILSDIDNFKSINDKHGHLYGDKVLTYVGKLIKKSFGEETFRYGGDEIAIATNKSKEDIIQTIDDINADLSKQFPSASISMSFGICLNEEGQYGSREVCLSNADKALYLSKKTKTKKYSFFEE